MRAVKERKNAALISASLCVGLLFLYSGDFPWPDSAHIYRDFSKGPTHYEVSLLLLYGIIVYSSIVFRTKIGILVAALVTAALLPQQVFSLHDIPFFRPISFGTAAILTAGLIGAILNRRDQEKEAQEIQQSLARQVTEVREMEKQALAHELHDVVLQTATDIAHEIDDLLEEVPETAVPRLRNLRTDIEHMMDQTRHVVRDLRPPMLDDIGLVVSLEELADLKAEKGLEITLGIRGEERRLPESMEAALFRISEEALNNVRRHSRATRVDIVVEFTQDEVHLHLCDNGRGFAVPALRKLVGDRKFGIVDMSERARLAGGTFQIESALGRGTVITVGMPTPHQS